MKIVYKIALMAVAALLLNSCYDKFTSDAPYSTVGFSLQNPVRTVISDRDMDIYVGVAIGGKRQVDTKDWATFEIDPSLLSSTSFTLLPANYYTLSDPGKFTVRKSNLPVADVKITFTAAFYADPKVLTTYYALPLRITGSSLDQTTEGKETTIVAVKCISAYHGVYYVKGKSDEITSIGGSVVAGTTVTYANSDLSKNFFREVYTRNNLQTVLRYAVSNAAQSYNAGVLQEGVLLTVNPSPTAANTYNVTVGTGTPLAISNGSGTYHTDGTEPRFQITYEYAKGGKFYRVQEELIRRQDPLYDLRVEQW